jgi:hypothetical protein
MKKLILVLAVIFGLAGCTDVKEVPRDAVLTDLPFLNLSGNYMAHAKVTENGESQEFDTRITIGVGPGPVTSWFGVPAGALPEKVVFDYYENEWFDFNGNVYVETSFTGYAVSEIAEVRTDFKLDNGSSTQRVTRDWVFSEITPFEDLADTRALSELDFVFSELVQEWMRDPFITLEEMRP